MEIRKHVQAFLDHNQHVGLSFYATDAAKLAKEFTQVIRSLSGDTQVVVFVRNFQLRVLREVLEPVVFTRKIRVETELAPSPLVGVRLAYHISGTRVARTWMECFLARSDLTFEKPEVRLLFQRVETY